MKNNDYQLVIDDLFPFIAGDHIEDSKAPICACHRYLSNRTHQLDDKGALERASKTVRRMVESFN